MNMKTIGYCAAFIMLGLVSASLGPTLPGLAAQTAADLGKISFLFTARALGYLCGSLLGGRLYDRLPGHPVMAIGLVLIAATMGGVPLAPQLWLLTGILFLTGMFESVIDVGGNTMIVWVHRQKVGPFMNALHFFFGVGAFLAPLIVAWTMKGNNGITWAYWTLAVCILPVAAMVSLVPGPHPATVSHEARTGKVNYLLVAGIALFMFLYTGAEVSFGGWIFTYALKQKLADATHAAYLTSAFWGALTVGRLFSIPLASRFKSATLLFSNVLGCLLSLGVILMAPQTLRAVWIGTLGLGLAMASIFPTALAFVGQQMAITGQITGLLFVGASVGAMLIPWMLGQVMNTSAPTLIIVILLAELAAALGVLAVIYVSLRKQRVYSVNVQEQPVEAVL